MNRQDYRKLLRIIEEHGYSIRPFGIQDTSPILYLRHDVDISPMGALRMATWEHREDVQSTYFFQPSSDAYNLFNNNVLKIVKSIRSWGHKVGLHLDESVILGDGMESRRIRDTLRWFNRNVTEIDPVVSFHRPSSKILGRGFIKVDSAYSDFYFGDKRYIADSGGPDPNFLEQVRQLLQTRTEPLQVVVHPVWWQGWGSNKEALLKTRKLRLQEIDKYWRKNFTKKIDL